MRLPPSVVFAASCLLATPAFAQAPPAGADSTAPASALDGEAPARAMTLDEALSYARTHQPAVVAARARIAAAAAESDVPRAAWKPTFGATAQLFGMTANNTTGTYASVSPLDIPRIGATRSVSSVSGGALRPYASSFVAVGAGQEIFDFGRIAARAAAADAFVDVAREASSIALLDLEVDVKESYYAVLAARGVLSAAEGAFNRSRVHRDFAKAGVDQGLRPPIELTRAEADLARFDVGRIRAKGGLRAAQSVLAAAVGVGDLVLDVSGEGPPLDDLPSLREALKRASERDPAVREAVARLRTQEARTRAIAAESRPDLSLTATLSGRAGGASPTSGDVATGSGLIPYVPNWDVGLVFTWPIYDATVDARANASRALEDAERAGIDVVRKEQVAAVQRAYVALDIARQALPALERARATAVANQQQADARFKQGLGTSVELADAESLRAHSEVDVALGRFEVARSRAQLARVLAEGLYPVTTKEDAATPAPATKSLGIPITVIGVVAAVLAGGAVMLLRSEAKTNKVALASAPKPVTVIPATAAKYRPTRLYVGTLQPWVSASIGPQLVSAYVDTVLVRPGSVVKKHEVLATLDCKSASAGSQAVAAQARALDARLKALADESARYKGLLDGGFVATNEVEQRNAATSAQSAEVNAAKAKLLGTTLEVNDCVLRAPFDGEVSARTMDPGAFVRPGVPIVSVVDRSTVRLSGDAPEVDFAVVAPGTEVKVHVLSTGLDVAARISRRAPAADPTTRTVHFEIDLADATRSIPVGTTGEIRIEVGEAVAATQLPLSSASVRGSKAVLYVVEGDTARSKTLKVLGESGGSLFVETTLPAGALVVSEGRALLSDGDKVTAKTVEAAK